MDTRVVVTKFLGVHLDFQLNWSNHLSGITNKIANHVSVMYRVRPFTVQIVHCLILPSGLSAVFELLL